MDLYECFKRYQVQADSLPDFLERHTKAGRHHERGAEYVAARIQSHQEDIDDYGYTFITHHDSVTGRVVSYYPENKNAAAQFAK